MKRAIFPALCLALLLSGPAVPQDTVEDELELRLRTLEEQAVKQQALLQEVQTYLGQTRGEAATLVDMLRAAEKKGFLYPAPNVDSRRALLYGMQRYAAVAAGRKPRSRPIEVDHEEVK
ncbi:MAG: hypothetical protein ACYTEZ_00660 [Planctomycetota bacterium]|jgi:hypothetical protein